MFFYQRKNLQSQAWHVSYELVLVSKLLFLQKFPFFYISFCEIKIFCFSWNIWKNIPRRAAKCVIHVHCHLAWSSLLSSWRHQEIKVARILTSTQITRTDDPPKKKTEGTLFSSSSSFLFAFVVFSQWKKKESSNNSHKTFNVWVRLRRIGVSFFSSSSIFS